MKSTIHLIRHGITEGNIKKWYYGWADIPLAKEGIDNLRYLCTQNIYPRPESAAYYTSGMIRTEQTFKEIYGDIPHEAFPMLKEMNFGEFETQPHDTLKGNIKYQQWIDDEKGIVAIPGGESRVEFYKRVNAGFDQLINLHRLKELEHRHDKKDAETVCICHGGVIACIMMDRFDTGLQRFIKWIPDPGRGYSIYLKDGKCIGYDKI